MKLELNKVYKDGSGVQWKVACIDELDDCVSTVNREQTKCVPRKLNGRPFYNSYASEHDLIELAGDDFTENLRSFEFNGILIEIIDDIHRVRNQDFLNNKVSKWEVTMKEIIK